MGGFRVLWLGDTKRTVYFWGLVLAIPSLLLVWGLQLQDPYIRFAYPTLAGLCAFWGWRLWLNAPLESIEQSATLGVGLLFAGKFAYSFILATDPGAQWREIESSYWAMTYVMILAYIAFLPTRALVVALAIVGFTALVGLTRLFPGLSDGSYREEFIAFARSEIRLLAMAWLIYILAAVKDRLQVATQQAHHMERLARTDPLTGLPNRLALSEDLAEAVQTPQDLFLVMVDIDHFKRINDQYGHNTGDKVLMEVAKRLRARLRKGDILGRWGGEELIVLMRGNNPDDIVQAVERLREEIALWPFLGVGAVSASFGVAQGIEGDTPHTLLNRADMALYRAKHSGRNRVEI
ncbi:MAG: GGDEF domain-containing protein [Meiothermus sp.]|nr:GGDEF domain-containing protein [Meiothermus sp.]